MSSARTPSSAVRDRWVLGLLALLAFELVAYGLYGHQRQISASAYSRYQTPADFLHTDGTHPPGPGLAYWALRQAWDIGAAVWNSVFAVVTALGLVALVEIHRRRLAMGPGVVRVALALLLLNAYGGWLMVTSNDTVFENLSLVWTLVFYEAMLQGDRLRLRHAVPVALLAFIGGMMRVTFYPTLLALALVDMVARPLYRARRLVVVVPVLAGATTLSAMHLHANGTFALTTSTTFNLFLGNNDYYLDVHPSHDIEILNPVAEAARTEVVRDMPGASPAAVDQEWRRRILEQALNRPFDALLRLALKAQWYLLGVAKVPLITEDPPTVVQPGGTSVVWCVTPARRWCSYPMVQSSWCCCGGPS